MKEWNELIQQAEKEPNNAVVWERIMNLAERKLNELTDGELKQFIIDFFQKRNEQLPSVINIEMGEEWEKKGSYTYLSTVLVDDEEYPELKDALSDNFDLQTLSNNSVIEFN